MSKNDLAVESFAVYDDVSGTSVSNYVHTNTTTNQKPLSHERAQLFNKQLYPYISGLFADTLRVS